MTGARPRPPPTQHGEADLPVRVALQVQADVVHLGGGAILGRAGHGDLELARQVGELGVQRCPLADDLAVGTRIVDLVGGDAGQVVGGDVAHAVAAGLDGVHLHGRELGEDLGHVGEPRPVELQVLPGGEMPVAAVVAARDVGELAQLGASSAGHRGSRCAASARDAGCTARCAGAAAGTRSSESSPGEVTARLVAELRDPLIDQRLVQLVVAVHGACDYRRGGCGRLNTVWFGAPLSGVMSVCNTSVAGEEADVAGLYFEQFDVGQRFEHLVRRTVTETDNLLFSALTMNPAAIHLDAEYSRGTPFGERIVNSVFTLGLLVGLSVYDTTYGTTVGNLGWEEVRFPRPVLIGDTLHARHHGALQARQPSRPDCGIVVFEHRACNQRDEEVASCRRAALMLKRPAA